MPTAIVSEHTYLKHRSEFPFGPSTPWIPKLPQQCSRCFVRNAYSHQGGFATASKVLVAIGHSCSLFLQKLLTKDLCFTTRGQKASLHSTVFLRQLYCFYRLYVLGFEHPLRYFWRISTGSQILTLQNSQNSPSRTSVVASTGDRKFGLRFWSAM